MQDSQVSPRALMVAFVFVITLIMGSMAMLLSMRPAPVQITINPPQPTATAEPTPTREPITVYVTGAVGAPGSLVTLPFNSRVQDALIASGGTTANADLNTVNLAAILTDGDQVHVSEYSAAPLALATSTDQRIAINRATLDELLALPGVGDVTAQAIITYREANGPFANLAALDLVDGIGPATLAQLEPLIRFD